MKERRYYSLRTGKNPASTEIDLELFRRLFFNIYSTFLKNDYFQETLGYWCVDADYVPGILGEDIELYFFRVLRKQNIWPIESQRENYSEDDVFDVIELLYDLVSKPKEGNYHSYNQCGWHYETFDKQTGQKEFLEAINSILEDYMGGFELSPKGEILILGGPGLTNIFNANVPQYEPDNVNKRVECAISKFRRYRSSLEERRDAVRDLADVLEYLRPQLKQVMTKDEGDLFNIANNFAIRHHNERQKRDYDPNWLSWIFYVYLSTIHLAIRLLDKKSSTELGIGS
ncbi:MAG TPA: hypothetical protein VFC84_18590 [Desulfosporosinus sp.]|nr:hypothetical protein [Desulfosporosinus sp.]